MKRIIFSAISCLIISTACNSVVDFKDEAFKAYMIENFDTNHDGEMSKHEMSLITDIDCRGLNIIFLNGIEYCTNLVSLNCMGNHLSSLDVRKNKALTELYCSDNQLTTLDVSKNTTLTKLDCSSNPLEVLNLGDVNPSHYYHDYGYVYSSCKDYPHFADGRLGSSTKLKVISTKITELDVSMNNLQSLDVSECPALTELYCYRNQLTTLDVSKNTALTDLDCYSNQLTTLDVSKNTALTTLECCSNQLTTLDVSKNTALTNLYCLGNQLTTLDVSKNTALTTLHCGHNQLTALNVSNNTVLTDLDCYSNQLTTLDVSKNTTLTKLDCSFNPLEVLNLGDVEAFQSFYLINGSCYSTKLKVISTKITKLNVSKNYLQSLDVSECPALAKLICYSNQLTTLDVSRTNIGNSTESHSLDCSGNSTLTTLYLKTGWSISGINVERSTDYIPSQTKILYKD